MKRTIRAKFKCLSVEDFGTTQQAKLSAVTGGSPENKSFWAASPGGQVSLLISNPDAKGFLSPGGEYYLDFTKADS